MQTGSELWRSFHIVLRQTARSQLPERVDLDACRAVLALAEAIEAGATTSAEDAMSAVELILCGYQRVQFQDADALGTLLGAALMRRTPGVVAMAVDPDHGVAGRERYPPNLAVLTPYLDKTSDRVRLAGWGARRGLGLTLTRSGDRSINGDNDEQ